MNKIDKKQKVLKIIAGMRLLDDDLLTLFQQANLLLFDRNRFVD